MSNSMYAWKYIIVLDIKEKNTHTFLLYTYCKDTNKRANSYKLKLLTIGNYTYGGRSQI